MNTLLFKTTIKCNACVTTVTPSLAGLSGVSSWEVDLSSPDRLLKVQTDGSVKPEQVIMALQEKGYSAIPVQ